MLIKTGDKEIIPLRIKEMIKRKLFIDYKKGMSVQMAEKRGIRNIKRTYRRLNAYKSGS